MRVSFRQGQIEDCPKIAELDYLASEGAVEYLFRDLVPDMSPLQLLTHGLSQDEYPHTYRSTVVAELDSEVVGMALAYPAEYHRVTEQLENFLPPDRMARFKAFYNSRVEDSYYLDALCVYERYRGRGIGGLLIEETKKSAIEQGYTQLSLIVFKDNTSAITLYENKGFAVVRKVPVEPHDLIPHQGGCLLMNCSL